MAITEAENAAGDKRVFEYCFGQFLDNIHPYSLYNEQKNKCTYLTEHDRRGVFES